MRQFKVDPYQDHARLTRGAVHLSTDVAAQDNGNDDQY